MNNISEKIKELREEAGLNSKQLAKKSDLSPAYISKLEKGNYETISLQTLKQLSEGLGLTLKMLLEQLGFINNGEKQSLSAKMDTLSLRSDGYTFEEAQKIIEYAKFLKQENKKRSKGL